MADSVSAIADLAVQIALTEAAAGVFERANDNRGERVDEYQQSTSGVLGEPWCLKFVFWCYEQAARRLNGKTRCRLTSARVSSKLGREVQKSW
jgi:hypothetical protein